MYVWMDMEIAVSKELLFVFAVKPWTTKAQDPIGFSRRIVIFYYKDWEE